MVLAGQGRIYRDVLVGVICTLLCWGRADGVLALQSISSTVTALYAFNTLLLPSFLFSHRANLLEKKCIPLCKTPHWLKSRLSNTIRNSDLLFLKIKYILVSMTVKFDPAVPLIKTFRCLFAVYDIKSKAVSINIPDT